ncbi:MAG: hypothetical protein KA998_00315 [Rickettsiaceae bacterium]|nr:hypothetical protein [Rickettsiaceae bacterium]
MRHFALCLVVLLFPTFVFAQKYRAINYSISYIVNAKTPTIKIDAEIIGDFSGDTRLSLPSAWASGEYRRKNE